jgi:solute carrier family 12 sodium/potassium/chloride transporter 2
MWLSLFGSLLCISVMFVIDWPMAFVTIGFVVALYVYVQARKPGTDL